MASKLQGFACLHLFHTEIIDVCYHAPYVVEEEAAYISQEANMARNQWHDKPFKGMSSVIYLPQQGFA